MNTKLAMMLIATCACVGIAGGAFVRSALSRTPVPTPSIAVSTPAGSIGLFKTTLATADSRSAYAASQAASVLSGDGASVPTAWKPGAVVAGTVRTVLTDGSWTVWAYQTTNGKVCEGLLENTALQEAGCTDGWSSEVPVDVNTSGLSNGSVVVWGLAPDNVKRVSVIVDGVSHQATMGVNSYLYESTPGSTVTAVLATAADGTTSQFGIENDPNPILGQ